MPEPPFDSSQWYKECLEPHLPMLRAWVASRSNSKADAEDIVQETVTHVLHVRQTREIESPKAFLFATAKNIAPARLRKQKTGTQVDLADSEDLDILIDDSIDLANEISGHEALEILTRAIQSLPARCRQVLTLRKIYGMSQKQIAKHLGISENTVETQIGVGMQKISDYFDYHELR